MNLMPEDFSFIYLFSLIEWIELIELCISFLASGVFLKGCPISLYIDVNIGN